MEDYLFNAAIDEGTVLVDGGSNQIAGPDLRNLVEKAREAKTLLNHLAQHLPVKILEQAAILGVLNPKILSDERHAGEVAELIAKRLDALEPFAERGWTGTGCRSAHGCL